MSSLQGKIALVTGSSRGIGTAIAISLAKEGASVVVNYVSASSRAQAEAVAREIEYYGPKSLVVQANVASLEDVDALVQKTISQFGKVDILVNNAGVVDFQPVGNITRESYSKLFDINVRATIFLSQAVIPYMNEGGRIINMSSAVARQGNPALTVYSATKAAIESITRVMGIELRDKGIRVTAVNPGPVVTDGWHEISEETRDKYKSIAGVAQPSDISDVVTFLAGPKSNWVTGSTISTNNGMILN